MTIRIDDLNFNDRLKIDDENNSSKLRELSSKELKIRGGERLLFENTDGSISKEITFFSRGANGFARRSPISLNIGGLVLEGTLVSDGSRGCSCQSSRNICPACS